MQFIFSEKRSRNEEKKKEFYIYWTGGFGAGGAEGIDV